MPLRAHGLSAVIALVALCGAVAPVAAIELAPLPDVTAAAVGDEHACAISRGQLWCWGRNREGQLGNGRRVDSNLAVPVVDLPITPTAVAVGGRHTCAIGQGLLYCWGDNTYGQLGTGDFVASDRPREIVISLDLGGSSAVSALALGRQHSCAGVGARAVYCWGINSSGQTGQPPLTPPESDNDPRSRAQPRPQRALSLNDLALPGAIAGLALGQHMSCAHSAEQALCWGRNDAGQLGDGSTTWRHQPAPVVDLSGGIRALAVGDDEHVCAALAAGGVRCWGNNYAGQAGLMPLTGQPETQIVTRPNPVPELSAVVDGLSASFGYSCAALGRELRCWGLNLLAPEFGRNSATPFTVFSLLTPIDALAGRSSALCANAGQRLLCVGAASVIARGQPLERLQAVAVNDLVHRQMPAPIVLGGLFGCQPFDGRPHCWGNNSIGQLGVGDAAPRSAAVTVSGVYRDIAVGRNHACASDAANQIHCWGYNGEGALGTGDLADRAVPSRATQAPAGRNVTAGNGFSCSYEVRGSREVACWGNNRDGQLGVPATPDPLLSAQRLQLPDVAVDRVRAGHRHACTQVFGVPDNQVWCWGRIAASAAEADNLRLGIVEQQPRRVDVIPAAGAELLSAAHTACLFDRANGQLQCWGRDFADPTTSNRGQHRGPHTIDLPVDADGVRYDAHVAVGGRHICAASTYFGRVRCIGLIGRACEFERELGRILTPGQGIGCSFGESMLTPAERGWLPVEGLPDLHIQQLAAGDEHACASFGRHTYCWGSNNEAQLGQATQWFFEAPVEILREGALAPAPAVPVTVDAARACPGYYVGSVSLLEPGDHRATGAWGQEILLTGGNRLLQGGLNFGGFGSAQVSPPVPGYAAFSIQSRDGRGQRVLLSMRGDGGEFTLQVDSTVPPSTERRNVLTEVVTLGDAPITRAIDLADGFHVIVLQPSTGERLFLVGANTTTLEGGPAAFQGGAVVGGFLRSAHTGFAAICTDVSQTLQLRTEARGERGPSGAGDLRLRVSEGQTGALLYDSANE